MMYSNIGLSFRWTLPLIQIRKTLMRIRNTPHISTGTVSICSRYLHMYLYTGLLNQKFYRDQYVKKKIGMQ